MKHAPLFACIASPRCRTAFAAMLCVLSLACFWAGVGLPLSPPSLSKAEAGVSPAKHAPAAGLAPARAQFLQSTVDSLALGLHGAFTALPASAEPQAVLAKALDSMTFELGENIYFTAWQGTRMAHSPATPDINGTDFAESLDARGNAFVQAMERTAEDGGGFVQATLPKYTRTAPAYPATPVPQAVYVRQIADSPWHIAAFTPVAPEPLPAPLASSVWENLARSGNGTPPGQTLRTGLCLSGASFAGLAGLLLIPRRREPDTR